MELVDIYGIFGINDLRSLPEAAMSVVTGDRGRRDEAYRRLIGLNHADMGRDWFMPFYEAELSERRQKGQDFSNAEVGTILARLAGGEGTIHEPTAGCGSLVISVWWDRCSGMMPWEFLPSRNQVCCWELSGRAVPLLLLNLSIRGIMGEVYHGDVLEGTVRQKYILLNRHDDALAFSDVVPCGINDRIVRI